MNASYKSYGLSLVAAIVVGAGLVLATGAQATTLTPGTLIKGESFASVYYYSSNGKRYVFPSERVYRTWYTDFSNVVTISDQELGTIRIGGNVNYRPGVKMLKIDSSPYVYVVAKGGVLRWVNSEAIASALYGNDWNRKIDDVPDTAFANYTMGADLTAVTDYNPVGQMLDASTIDVDKGVLARLTPQTPAPQTPAPQVPAPQVPAVTLDPNDNSDASHPELDITRPENQNQANFNRIADDPRYRAAYYGDYGPTSTVTGIVGMMRGCVGTFSQTSTPQRGTLIKGSASYVYYYASNGKRYIFPSALELQSWYGARTPMGGLSQLTDTRPCRAVVQVPDSVLAGIQIGGNVTVRPDAYVVTTDSTEYNDETRVRYIVEAHRTLRPITVNPADGEYVSQMIDRLYPLQGDGEVFSIPDALFHQDYTIGAPFTRTSTLSPSSATIEQELGIR